MSKKSVQDRAEGALLGAWIGDALGLGPHWYYNLEELRRDRRRGRRIGVIVRIYPQTDGAFIDRAGRLR